MAVTLTTVKESASAWQVYLQGHDWQALTSGIVPKQSGWGLVYELGDPLDRPSEDLALCDLSGTAYGEPHFHPAGVWEVYIILEGSMLIVLGGKGDRVTAGDTVVIPPQTAHFAIPDATLKMGLISIPPFSPENYRVLTGSNQAVSFDYEQFEKLTES